VPGAFCFVDEPPHATAIENTNVQMPERATTRVAMARAYHAAG
jgi:hypothetical protein